MSDLNVFSCTGRLTKDGVLSFTGTGTAMLKFSIANNTGFGDRKKVQFFECVMWGKRAESLVQYLKKGKPVACTGMLEANNYTDSRGADHKTFNYSVNDLILLGDGSGPRENGVGGTPIIPQDNTPEDVDMADIPF